MTSKRLVIGSMALLSGFVGSGLVMQRWPTADTSSRPSVAIPRAEAISTQSIESSPDALPEAVPSDRASEPLSLARRERVPAESYGALHPSFQGTDIDGAFELDAAGRFVPSPSALRVFDYFFSAAGLEPDDVIRGRIVLHIERQLPEAATEQAVALLDGYLRLRERLADLERRSSEEPRDPREQLRVVRELRRAELGVELSERLYGEQERIIEVEIERRGLLLQRDLEPSERAARLAELQDRLPDAYRAAAEASRSWIDLNDRVEALRASGATDQEVFELRERAVGREAAQRLADLDARRAVARGE